MDKTSTSTNFLMINYYIIIGYVVLTFCFDFLDKIELFYNIGFPKFNRLLKIAIVIYSICFIFYKLSYVLKNLKYLILTLLGLSLIFFTKFEYWNIYHLEFFRYIFILVFFPVLHYSFIHDKHQKISKAFYIILKIFIIINIVAILMGLIFEIKIFQTYEVGRFGYNGMLLSQGLTPYIYLASVLIFWTKKNYWMLIAVLLASLLSGVKGVYFVEFILFFLLILVDKKKKMANKIKAAFVCLVFFLGVLAVIFSTPIFREVIENDGIISAIFSYRTDNLIELFQMNSSNNYNLFTGANGLETVRVELQFFDILLFFGIIGLIIYGYFMFSVYNELTKNHYSKIFLLTALFLSFLSGNLFYIPFSITIFFLTIFYLNCAKDPIDQIKDK